MDPVSCLVCRSGNSFKNTTHPANQSAQRAVFGSTLTYPELSSTKASPKKYTTNWDLLYPMLKRLHDRKRDRDAFDDISLRENELRCLPSQCADINAATNQNIQLSIELHYFGTMPAQKRLCFGILRVIVGRLSNLIGSQGYDALQLQHTEFKTAIGYYSSTVHLTACYGCSSKSFRGGITASTPSMNTNILPCFTP